MTRLMVAAWVTTALLATPAAVAVLAAPAAVADPNDLVPACTGGQVAETGECNAAPVEAANPLEGFFGDAPGGNPNTPAGLTPLLQPVVVPLGLLPGNLPVVFPLGVTPPNIVSGR
jgi:hypothetical protein